MRAKNLIISLVLLWLPLAANGQGYSSQTLDDGVKLYTRNATEKIAWYEVFRNFFKEAFSINDRPFGKSVAFLVGVSDYKNLKPLPYVRNDLRDMTDYLMGDGGFDQVYVASDEVVTRDLIENYMLDILPDQLEKEDRLLFYFAGHGSDNDGQTGYLQFQNAEKDKFRGNQILKISDINDWRVEDLRHVNHLLFILDNCSSGLGIEPVSLRGTLEEIAETLSKGGSRYVITAGTADEETFEVGIKNKPGSGNGVFTRAILDALQSGSADHNGDGLIIIDDLIGDVKVRMANFSSSKGQQVTPQLFKLDRNNFRGSFLFLNPEVDLDELTDNYPDWSNHKVVTRGEKTEWVPIEYEHIDYGMEELAALSMQANKLTVLEHAAFTGNPVAERRLGKVQKFIFKNDKQAVKWLERAAKQGDVISMIYLGQHYYDQGEQGYKKSFYWFFEGANEGHDHAQHWLAHLYENGYGVPVMPHEAFKWYKKSAEQNNPHSQYYLGRILLNGTVGAQDLNEAFAWFEKSANQDYAPGQRELAFCYYRGEGTTEDVNKAVFWFEKAAKGNDAEAQYVFGIINEDGIGGVTKNINEAFRWYYKAADQGDTRAQAKVGHLYFLNKDYDNAEVWFKKAALKGHSGAQSALGSLYFMGLYDKVNYKEAVKWFSHAAAQGEPNAQYDLANCFLSGHGVEKNEQLAAKWFNKACDNGMKKACTMVGR